MSILVDDKPIEIVLRYADRKFSGGAVGALAFLTDEEEREWVERENKKRSEKAMELKALGKDVPEQLEQDAKEDVKQVVTFWKRMDWGTQTKILDESRAKDEMGQPTTDWTKYRLSQMSNLMVGWDLKAGDKPIPINEKILKRIDFNIAVALINKYEETVAPEEEELENLG
jgi:hypothetical protein